MSVWTGEGLPPVGVEFEWRYSSSEWKRGEALYIGTVYAILKSHDHEQHYYVREMQFRPIRTPEQIAAEKEKADIAAIKSAMPSWCSDHEKIATCLYHAGLRFEVMP